MLRVEPNDSNLRWYSLSYHASRGDIKGYMLWGICDRGAFVSGCSASTGELSSIQWDSIRDQSSKERGLGGITDGTSNTILLSEVAISSGGSGGEGRIKGSLAQFLASDDVGSHVSPNICFNKQIGSGMVNPTYSNATYGIGNRWTHGEVQHTAFYTILAPNQPSCIRADGTWALVTASSYHTGGVNVALCDASVRFISETINAGDPAVDPLKATGTTANISNPNPYVRYTGPSIHGIWGALGTVGGGESAAP
jgi:prepilin-type processing-associated H-X9-DG protein